MKYFDNSATTPIAPEVKEAINHYLDWTYGNPSSHYKEGQLAQMALLHARQSVASLINASAGNIDEPGEVFFTGSGTESDNLAILGVVPRLDSKRNEFITSSLEHPAVLNTFAYLEKQGYKVTYLPADDKGNVSLSALEDALSERTVLVSIMMANNEIGTIQPICALSEMTHRYGALFHTDAVQALGKVKVDVQALGVDLLSISAHKIYGPKGIGALYVRHGLKINPIMHGGHQEYRIRPGTENMLGIAGFDKACELLLIEGSIEKEAIKKAEMATRLRQGLTERLPDIFFNGNIKQQIPGHLSTTFRFVEGESLLMYLNLKDIACSSGSACSAGSTSPSHVLTAIGLKPIDAQSTVRLTIGRYNTDAEIDYLLETIPPIVEKLRKMSPLARKDR